MAGFNIDPSLTPQLLGNKYTQPNFFAPQNTWNGNQLQIGGAMSGPGFAPPSGVRPQGIAGVLSQLMMGRGQPTTSPMAAPPMIGGGPPAMDNPMIKPPQMGGPMPPMDQAPPAPPMMDGGFMNPRPLPPQPSEIMPSQPIPPGQLPPPRLPPEIMPSQPIPPGQLPPAKGMGLAGMLRGMNFAN